MADTLLEYKCPNCGGKLEFDSGAQNMKCPYCDAEFDVEALKDLDEELKEVKPDDLGGINSAHDKTARTTIIRTRNRRDFAAMYAIPAAAR